jgi:hypothetical protein
MTHPPNTLPAQHSADSSGVNNGAPIATAKAVALTLVLLALWSFTHLYQGLAGDAELYALQALARIRPGLAADLYLQNLSQDHFTIFSPLYSWFIRLLGLRSAALTLTLVLAVWFLIAAWALVREVSTTAAAFLAVTFLIIIRGTYGSYGVFSYSENLVTARSLAEALTVTAIACHFLGKKRLGLLIASAALLVHPIMALPGVLLLVCVRLPLRVGLIGAALGILGTLGIAVVGSIGARPTGLLAIMDAAWSEIVRERSQFLFLQFWTAGDWEVNARPFLYLTISALTMPERIRKLSIAAMIVGASGLAVAAIAGLIGPVAVLLQGQAWRWVWITRFISVLLLAPTALKVWRDEKCGPLCSILLILGWTYPVIDSDACIALVLILWLLRDRISVVSARYLQWASVAIGVVVVGWILANSWTVAFAPSPESGRDPPIIAHIRNVLGLGPSAVLIASLLFYCIRSTSSVVALTLISTPLAVGMAFALQGSLMQRDRNGTAAEIKEFSDWRNAIPPTSTVFIIPANNSKSFVWFTLERASYLSEDQSAGVVYSRATALEVKRRSQVLLPVLDPDWRWLSKNRGKAKEKKDERPSSRPLTRESLISLCGDPVMDFVIAKESLAFEPIRHTDLGEWKDWNLYDCRRIRSLVPSA